MSVDFENGGSGTNKNSSPDCRISGAGLEEPTSGTQVISFQERGSLVTARGTKEGLVLRVDGRVPGETIKAAVRDFADSRRAFLGGQEIFLEWYGAVPEDRLANEMADELLRHYQIKVIESRVGLSRVGVSRDGVSRDAMNEPRVAESRAGVPAESRAGVPAGSRAVVPGGQTGQGAVGSSLFDGAIGAGEGRGAERKLEPASLNRGAEAMSFDAQLWDDPDTRIVYATLRSGQRVESEYSLVILGDVNSGAEVVAGGDIIVLGALRGVAHAGAYEETGGGRFVFALNLQATQLRIGAVISRGSHDQRGGGDFSRGPEIARVDGALIVVEPFNPRAAAPRGFGAPGFAGLGAGAGLQKFVGR